MRLVTHRNDPGLKRRPRGIRAAGDVVAANLHDAFPLVQLLGQDVAEHAALFLRVVLARRPQLVQHPSRHVGRRHDLRSRMVELLSAERAKILEYAHVFEAVIVLQVLQALRAQQQKLLNLGVARQVQSWRSWRAFSTITSCAPTERITS